MTLLDNRYQVTEELGEGAFGKTYIAVDTRSQSRRQCVVKQLKLVATPEQNHFYQSLFQREAKVLEQIGKQSQGRIPKLLAYFTQAGDHFFVMELVSGWTLGECIAKDGKQEEARVRGWLIKILETLDFIHGVEYTDKDGKKFRGVIHRDIKPGNIIIRDSDGFPVLIDFGVVKEIAARSTVRNDGTLTMTAGTPFYMPPEQEKGSPVMASDLYALGVTAMVALTGKKPINLYNLTDLSFEWRKFAPGISRQLGEALDRATQTKTKDRFQTAREMIKALATPPSVTVLPIPAPGPTPLSQRTPRTPPPIRSSVNLPIGGELKTPKTSSIKKELFLCIAAVFGYFGILVLTVWISDMGLSKKGTVSPTASNTLKEESKTRPSGPSPGTEEESAGGIKFVFIPAGEFQMGTRYGNEDERPEQKVVITEPFWMGKFEVTQGQWEAWMGNNPSKFRGRNLPVEQVNWDDCQAFIRKLNDRNGLYTYRLPTEAEWEYTCRAGTTGDYSGDPDRMAWYQPNSGGKTHPVGQKQPNAWGLYDMPGNVQEWCEDRKSYYRGFPVTNPTGGDSFQPERVCRGGSFGGATGDCRSTVRHGRRPQSKSFDLGFRLVRVKKSNP